MTLNRFLGGPPLTIFLRLVIISFVVGVVLSALGLSPYDLVASFTELLERIYNLGFGAFEWMWRYLLLGAVIVVPVWLVLRILNLGRGGPQY